MKGRKRGGATLPMVIISVILVSSMVWMIASVVDTGSIQTSRFYSYLTAKYIAVSGSQLALGAYFEGDGETSPLYTEFENRAQGRKDNSPTIESIHEFSYGRAEVKMSGYFKNNSSLPGDYYITITSRSKLLNSDDYYVHTVEFNWDMSGIRTEKGGIENNSKW